MMIENLVPWVIIWMMVVFSMMYVVFPFIMWWYEKE